jgi:hypothetical protein
MAGAVPLSGAWHSRRAADVLTLAPASVRTAGHLTARAIAEHTVGASLMSGPETVLASARLSDGELRSWPRRRGLPLGPRERRSNQRPMNGTVLALVVSFPGFLALVIQPVGASAFATHHRHGNLRFRPSWRVFGRHGLAVGFV